jgi:SAM-dependent methyltransferase
MTEAFNVNEYWLGRGRDYMSEAFPHEFHRVQEQFLLAILRATAIPLNRILEIGCGFGRITRLLAEAFPQANIMALDLSPDQLANARDYCGKKPNISFQQYDFYSTAPFPGRDYDAVIAVEVLLHHPTDFVLDLIKKLSTIAQYIVNIDWSEHWPWKTADHVWVHDYSALYAGNGLQTVSFNLPAKIEGLQQKLFLASKQLSPSIFRLEREARDAEASAGTAFSQPPSEAAGWPQQVDRAIEEIRKIIPPGATFLLVNDNSWGKESSILKDYRVYPFLERDGQYWGPPADDQTALSELERMRQAGARYIAFAWSSFWWLDFFTGLRDHLDSTAALLLKNDRLVIYRLNS